MIRVQNVYYMLAYAFNVLTEQGYKNIAVEKFANTGDLLAAILIRGVGIQIKRGLGKAYIPQREALSFLKGRIDVAESIKSRTYVRKQMVCAYDEFCVNSYMNRILKTTMLLLLKGDITKARRKELRSLLVYFSEVDTVALHNVDWHMRYDKNNQTYRMLMAVCYLVVKGLLQTKADGRMKMMDFLDEQRMHHLYEKFILEYYRKEFPQVNARPAQIRWQLDDEVRDMLPVMQTDIMLQHGKQILIIDAKYYARTTQRLYGTHKLHSGNLYQIFTYVKNKEVEMSGQDHSVAGMLLYARTDEEMYPEKEYSMSGNTIAVQTLDLGGDFSMIRHALDRIVLQYFPEVYKIA